MISSIPAILLFYSMLFISTLMTVSAPHWMLAWFGMELNMLCFVPLITMMTSGQSSEAGGKYFLAQATGSAIFLLGVALWFSGNLGLASAFILMGLLVKIGGVPVHQWFPATVAGLPWSVVLVLMTWQKIGPVMLLMVFVREESAWLMMGLAGVNVLFGALGGLNQTQMRPLLAYSSISHIGWVLALIPMSLSAATTYLGIYIFISGAVLVVFGVVQYQSIKVASMGQMMPLGAFFSCGLLLLSLAGMPPFSGFFMKAYALAVMIESGFIGMAIFFIVCATMSLAFYMNILFLSILSVVSVGGVGPYKSRWGAFVPILGLGVGGLPFFSLFFGL